VLLLIYTLRHQVTQKFRIGIFAATRIALFYVLEMVLRMFGIQFAAINGSGAIGIGSAVCCGDCSVESCARFRLHRTGRTSRPPKYMEWYGAFGIMVTLVWLYFEILLLLSKLRSRNRNAHSPVRTWTSRYSGLHPSTKTCRGDPVWRRRYS